MPHLAGACETWIGKANDHPGIALASEQDIEPSKAGHPLRYEFADCVLALSISAHVGPSEVGTFRTAFLRQLVGHGLREFKR